MGEHQHGLYMLIDPRVGSLKNLCRYHQNNQGNNNSRTILKEISFISFPNLKLLSIPKNKITSIEGMCRIHIPVLEHLYISNFNLNQVIT